MSDGPDFAAVAALIGEPSRADMLAALLSGRALTATELAGHAMISKPTASSHLGLLVDSGLVAVERQGRHRFFRLADRDVAEVIEALVGLAVRTGAMSLRPGPREPALRHARVCYDHLAGEVAVLLFERLTERGYLHQGAHGLEIPTAGEGVFASIGLDLSSLGSRRRPLTRTCLDWSERRLHLAGSLGAALLERFIALGWARRAANARAIRITPPGERALRDVFGVTRPMPLLAAGLATPSAVHDIGRR
jgi:DNA-binding transcriptional ArsR family regulator